MDFINFYLNKLFEKFKNKELLIIQELKNMPKQYKIYNITLLYSF